MCLCIRKLHLDFPLQTCLFCVQEMRTPTVLPLPLVPLQRTDLICYGNLGLLEHLRSEDHTRSGVLSRISVLAAHSKKRKLLAFVLNWVCGQIRTFGRAPLNLYQLQCGAVLAFQCWKFFH